MTGKLIDTLVVDTLQLKRLVICHLQADSVFSLTVINIESTRSHYYDNCCNVHTSRHDP
jgi:hypothetical protein